VAGEQDTESLPTPLPEQITLPPLRVHHFLAWMAVMALMFAVLARTGQLNSSQTLWTVTVVTVGHVLSSAGLTCLAFGAVWWWCGLRFPSEPGHAFVIFTGLGTLLSELLVFLCSDFLKSGDEAARAFYGMSGGSSQWAIWLMRWSGSISAVLLAVLSISFAIWLVRGWRWRVVLVLLATMFVAGAAELVLWTNLSIDAIPTAVLLLCLALAVMEDRRLAISRHWSHWVGVGIFAFDGAFRLAKYAVWYLLLGGT